MRAVGSATAVLSLALLGLCACGSSPGGFGARFTENGALLLDGPAARMTPAAAAAERAKAVPLLYQFAIDAGQVPPAPGVAAVPDADTLAAQEIALTRVANWKKVTLAGEAYIDKQCQDFLAALDVLEKSRRTTLANLNSLQSATTGIMGLVRTAQETMGITGIAFGLASSLFDQTISTVLYQLPASSVTAIVEAQRQSLRNQETAEHATLEWQGIDDRPSASARLYVYIQYCAPLTIEATITKVLNKTGINERGYIVVTPTPPAATGGSPAPIQAAPPLPPAPPPALSPPPPPPRPPVGRRLPPLGAALIPAPVPHGCSPLESDRTATAKSELRRLVDGLETKPGEPPDSARKARLDDIYAALAAFSRSDPRTALNPVAPARQEIEARNIRNYIFKHVCSDEQLAEVTSRLQPFR